MCQEKWINLKKGICPNHFNFEINSAYDNCFYPSSTNFSQCAFDPSDEALVAIDSNGIAYYIDLTNTPSYKKLGCVGLSTFLTFNPNDKTELLIGLSSTNIKVLRIHAVNEFCLLVGHTAPPVNISFYKGYFLTSSSQEVIVWQLKSFSKVHQLRLNVKSIVLKKAIFSSLGVIAVLYQTNIIQSWLFKEFDKDFRIDIEKHGLKNVKDFEFSKDGRAMIVCGLQDKILVFNTTRWDLLISVNIHDNFPGAKQLSVVPLPLDGGSNSIIALLASDTSLKFVSLATASLLENCCELQNGIKRITVSHKGCYLAYMNKYGLLDIVFLDKMLNDNLSLSNKDSKDSKESKESKKIKKSIASPSHKAEAHLKHIRQTVKEELKLKRLLPILKEYGEYPEKFRKLIWATIMELPNNKKAYIELSNKVPHEGMFELLKSDPDFSNRKSSLLATTLSCLLHWSPVLQECLFLPKMIPSFINIFQKNPVIGFEACLYILLNYCQKWFEYHPLPPLNILGIIENVLLESDPVLFDYFCEHGITSTDYAWPLLQTMLSEVLGAKDWLILWDHLLSIQKPWLLLLCTVAYNILYRKTITSSLRTTDDFQQFYKTQGHVSAKSILKLTHKLDCDTPYRIHPRRYLKSDINTIPNKGPYAPFLQSEFPKFVTDELRGANLKKLKEKERRLRGYQLHALELIEEKKLKRESENFVKQIHEMRLNELRKCYENQLREDERYLEYAKKETENLDPNKYLHNTSWSSLCFNGQKSTSGSEHAQRRIKSKEKKCKLLQEQVERLEFEVQNLLLTLQNNSSRPKSRT